MSGLAHYFEDEGLATVVIALVREHVEKMRPPRALWVPFELGRPLGEPDDVELQRQVLTAALALLDRPALEPVLEDFAVDHNRVVDEAGWHGPVTGSANDAVAEVSGLLPLWQAYTNRTARTSTGISGLEPLSAVEFIQRFFTDDPMHNPKGMAVVSRARFCVDDIKAFYFEAALADGGRPSSPQLGEWFWNQTLGGKMLLEFQDRVANDEDRNLRLIASSLVPAERTYQYF